MWLITNKILKERAGFELVQLKDYRLLTDEPLITVTGNTSKWLIEGYIIPRLNVIHGEKASSNSEILNSLISKFGDSLVDQVKGVFTIIQINDDGFRLISDHFGIKKFFIFQKDKEFIISNDLRAITSLVSVTPSVDHMAVYALTYHFVGGLTIFKEIRYNDSAEIISYRNNLLQFSRYWNPEVLLNNNNEIISQVELAQILVDIIKTYLSILKSEKVSLSLTGGVDSRLLFSILMGQDIKLHTYTYGNPESFDCVVSKIIADDFNIPHSIHDIRFTKETFKIAAGNSIKSGQSLCSLHRAHRLKAIEMEASYGEAMLLGTMGGEFVKSSNLDDYIISNFVYEFSRNKSMDIITKYLKGKAINISHIDIDKLMDFFIRQSWCKKPEQVDFYGLVEIAARLHHAQNDMHYSNFFKFVFTPYLDIDYLTALFKSRYNLIQKKKFHTKFFQRLNNLEFASEMQSILNKKLTDYPYSSGFMINEYLQNKVYAAVRSRLRKRSWKSIPNFPLNDFIKDFTRDYLRDVFSNGSIVSEVFEIKSLLSTLETDRIGKDESSWIKFTTPVQMDMTLRDFS